MPNKKNLIVYLSLSVLIIAIFQSIFLFLLIQKGLTGRATDTAAINITINQKVSANFSVASINWGVGALNSSNPALLDTTGPNVTGGNWSISGVSNLHIVNNGNVNVTLDIKSEVTNATLFGGTGPVFKLKIIANETNSCLNSTGTGSSTNSLVFIDANITGDGTRYCELFPFEDNKDSIFIGILLGIPIDTTVSGQRNATLTATVSAV